MKQDYRTMFYTKSADEGVSFSYPVVITDQVHTRYIPVHTGTYQYHTSYYCRSWLSAGR